MILRLHFPFFASLALVAWSWGGTASGAEIAIPTLHGPVEDLAHILSAEESAALATRLLKLREGGGPQFQLLTVPTLDGEPIEHFAIRIFDQWKLGDEKRDDGLLMLVAVSDHRMRIEVGQGLEGQIPDITASRVIREVLRPAFKEGAFAGGIEAAMQKLAEAAGRTWPVGGPTYVSRSSGSASSGGPFNLGNLIWLGFVLFFLISSRGRGGSWILWALLSNNGRGGGGWSGGGGGGGWSGGGGSSSGGGSSGSW